MAYEKTLWKARAGTNLNKFTKWEESDTSVILTNAPDAITEAGTHFTAAILNNMEEGIDALWSPNVSFFATGFAYSQGCTAIGSDLYFVDYADSAVKKITSAGVVTTLASGIASPYGLAAIGTDLYVTEFGFGNVKKITSAGVVTTFAAGLTTPRAIAVIGTDLYVAESGTGVIKKITSAGVVTTFASGFNEPNGLVAIGTDLYVIDYPAFAVKRISSVGEISTIATGFYDSYAIAAIGTDLYIPETNTGVIKKLDLSTYMVSTICTGLSEPYGITAIGANLYVSEYTAGYIKKIDTTARAVIAPTSVLTINMSVGTTITLTENRFKTLLLTGTITENKTLIVPTEARAYKVICNCTGAYYVWVKTAAGTGVYFLTGTTQNVYCGGTNIDVASSLAYPRGLTGALSAAQSITAGAFTTITYAPDSNVLNEFTAGVFTAKQKCKISVSMFLVLAGTSMSGDMQSVVLKNGAVYIRNIIYYPTAITGSIYSNVTSILQLNKDDTFSLQAFISNGTSVTVKTGTIIKILIE